MNWKSYKTTFSRKFSGKHLRICVIALALLTGLAATAQIEHPLPTNPSTSPDTLIPASERKPATDFTLTDSNGRIFTLAKTKGQVVILNFWATWCGGCKFELPYFSGYDETYRKQGLITVGISMDGQGFSIVKPFWVKHSMPYPTVIGSDTLANQLGLKGMPFTLLLDRKGRIAVAHAGVLDRADFDHHIQQLLQEKD